MPAQNNRSTSAGCMSTLKIRSLKDLKCTYTSSIHAFSGQVIPTTTFTLMFNCKIGPVGLHHRPVGSNFGLVRREKILLEGSLRDRVRCNLYVKLQCRSSRNFRVAKFLRDFPVKNFCASLMPANNY